MRIRVRRAGLWLASCAFAAAVSNVGFAQPGPPSVNGRSSDPVAHLNKRLAGGAPPLEFKDDGFGYLRDVLNRFNINPDSQVLVFSKTSLQFDHIGPATPRAIYFNDNLAVAFVQHGGLIELATTDPNESLAFYSLDNARADTPRFQPHGVECERCHNAVRTFEPGLMVTSTPTTADGTPLDNASGQNFNVTSHKTPFADRWAGWYVTGTHGAQRHLGNAIIARDDGTSGEGLPGTQNRRDLTGLIDTSKYLLPTSDIVALMTLEHQLEAMNLMTKIGVQARQQPGEISAQPANDGLQSGVDAVADYLLFADEAPLTAEVTGSSTFEQTFAARGPKDPQGRSLREFDLRTRLFKYPLSYMIYSDAFVSLPAPIRARVYRRLYDVLTSATPAPKFTSLSGADRHAIIEIVRATKPDVPDFWRVGAS